MDDKDLLWNFYHEHTTHGRHHENQRQAATTTLLAIAAGSLGLAGLNQTIDRGDRPLALLLVLTGVWGFIFILKHYERFRLHMIYARLYRRALDQAEPTLAIEQNHRAGEKEHESEWQRGLKRWIHRSHLYWFWASIPLVIALIGALMLVSTIDL